VPVGAILPVSGDRTEDDVAIVLAHRLVAEAEAADNAGPEVLDQHVRSLDDPASDQRVVRLFQVERDRPLACVRGDERGAHSLEPAVAPVGAKRVAAGRFDLDDLRSEQREKVRRIGPGHHVAEVGHTISGERLGHGNSGNCLRWTVQPNEVQSRQCGPTNQRAAWASPLRCQSSQATPTRAQSPPLATPSVPPWPTGRLANITGTWSILAKSSEPLGNAISSGPPRM